MAFMLTQLKLPCYRPSVSPTCSADGAVGGGNMLRTQPQRLQQQWSVAWPTAGIDEAGRGLLMQFAGAFRAGLVICIMQGLASACLICILWAIAAIPFFHCRRFVSSVEYVCTYIHRAQRQRGWGREILSEYKSPVLLDFQVIGRSKRTLINWANISAPPLNLSLIHISEPTRPP